MNKDARRLLLDYPVAVGWKVNGFRCDAGHATP